MESEAFAYLFTFLFVVLLTDFLRRQALSAGLVDRPNPRKRHRGLVPPVGGEAIFLGCLLSALALGVPARYLVELFAVGAILVVVGALDDCLRVSVRARLVAQALAALILALAGGVVLESAGAVLPGGRTLELGVLAIPFTVFCAVGVINAFNMVDGMDGLSGCLALVALAALAWLAADGGATGMLTLLLVLACGIAAFLALNARYPWRWQASVFLGDAGSTFIGFALAWAVLRLSQGPDAAMSPVTGLWLLMVPLCDIGFVALNRMVHGQSPLRGDRQHLHHYFLRAGVPVTGTLAIIVLLALAGAAVGLAGHRLAVPDALMLAGFVAFFLLYSAAMTAAWRRYPRLVRRLRRRHRHSRLPVSARLHLAPLPEPAGGDGP